MYKFSKRSLDIIAGLHKKLGAVLMEAIKHSPHDFGIHEGHRSLERQLELYNQGRTTPGKIVTWLSGTKEKGYHNYKPSLAFDFHCSVPGKTWDIPMMSEIARHILKVGKEMGIELEWGGHWGKGKVDYPHIQLPLEFKHYAEKEKLY